MSRDVPKGEQTVFRHSGGWESVSFDYTSFWKNLAPEAFQNTQISLSVISGAALRARSDAQSEKFNVRRGQTGPARLRAGHGGAAVPSAVAATLERGVTAGPGCPSGPGVSQLWAGEVFLWRCRLRPGRARAIYALPGRPHAGQRVPGALQSGTVRSSVVPGAQRKVLGSAAGHGAGERLPARPALCRM